MTEFTDSETEPEKPLKDTLETDFIKNDNLNKTVESVENVSRQKETVEDGACIKKETELCETKYVNKEDNDVDRNDSEGDDDDSLEPGNFRNFIIHFSVFKNTCNI